MAYSFAGFLAKEQRWPTKYVDIRLDYLRNS
jgi:hypothetical protein